MKYFYGIIFSFHLLGFIFLASSLFLQARGNNEKIIEYIRNGSLFLLFLTGYSFFSQNFSKYLNHPIFQIKLGLIVLLVFLLFNFKKNILYKVLFGLVLIIASLGRWVGFS